ncbi:MAG: cyclic nucleotide-binding domain-containing protein [Limibacillus sp.]|jgi:CRP-like cAMP-binding protein
MNKVSIDDGAYLFRKGEYGGAYIVESGEVALEGLGRTVVIGEGDIVGEVSLTGRAYLADARAVGAVEATELTRDDLLTLARIPNEAEALVEALLEKIVKLTESLLAKPE